MKRLPFKRQLIILACIITALCVAIPVTTFAKQSTPPPGAGEHHVSVQHSLQPAASGQPVTITADCSSPQPIVTFNTGDTVSGTAVIVTSSGDPAEEQGEHENLQLGGTNVPTIPGNPFAVDSGTHPINFKATGSGTLTGCITLGVNGTGFDNDESATVTVTVTPAPPPPPPPPTPTPVPTPPPPITKHIPINGTNTIDTVKDSLHKYAGQLALSCSIELFGDKIKFLGLIGKGQNALTVVELDYDLAVHPVNRDLLAAKVIIAITDVLPVLGCSEAIVNLVTDGGIDLLKACLTDRGCLTQVENDPQVKRLLCIASIDAIVGNIPGSFPALVFIENRLC